MFIFVGKTDSKGENSAVNGPRIIYWVWHVSRT